MIDKSRYGEGLACRDMADGALVIVIEGTRGGRDPAGPSTPAKRRVPWPGRPSPGGCPLRQTSWVHASHDWVLARNTGVHSDRFTQPAWTSAGVREPRLECGRTSL